MAAILVNSNSWVYCVFSSRLATSPLEGASIPLCPFLIWLPERFVLFHDSVAVLFVVSVWQLRSDFIASEAGASPPLSAQEECLGLAVLDLWRMAKERHQSVKELCKTVRCHTCVDILWERLSASSWSLHGMTIGFHSSYKSCLPRSHRMDIQKRNVVDRYRIRHTLKHFLKKLGSSSVDEYSLKLKYLIELTGINPTMGSETYQVNHSTEHLQSTFTHVRVNGETGIQTSSGSHTDGAQVS